MRTYKEACDREQHRRLDELEGHLSVQDSGLTDVEYVVSPPEQSSSTDCRTILTHFRLLTLTTTMHAKLPRELRDMIYSHLYDVISDRDFVSMILAISEEAREDLRYRWKKLGIHPDGTWPRFVMPKAVCTAFAEEAVQVFYEQTKDIVIMNAYSIEHVLNCRFFNLNTAMADSYLSALSMCLRLFGNHTSYLDNSKAGLIPYRFKPQEAGNVYPLHISSRFAPLLQQNQQLAAGFKLTIVLFTSYLFENFGLDHVDGSILIPYSMLRELERTVKALNPVLADFRKQCKADIAVWVLFGDDQKVRVTKEYMEFGVSEWNEAMNTKWKARNADID